MTFDGNVVWPIKSLPVIARSSLLETWPNLE